MCQTSCEITVKFGKDLKGNQKYRCKCCGRVWVVNPNSTHLTEEQKELIDRMLKENISIRAISRIVKCSHVTILNFLRKKEKAF